MTYPTSFQFSKIALGIAFATAASSGFAAGLDRSGQDIKGFFKDGTYAEVDYIYIDTDISGQDNGNRKIDNITKDPYQFARYGVKADVNDNVSLGVFYDEPWGAKVAYSGNNDFISNDQNTNVNVHTQSWTGLVGLKSNGFQIYGGPVLQKAKADVHLRGSAYGPLTGYDANVNSDTAVGWAAGVAYSKPEIALNAALTYRSEIEHKATIGENIPLMGSSIKNSVAQLLGITDPAQINALTAYSATEAKITTPKSVNLNLQSGISREHQLLGTLDVRWVPWSDFTIVPPYYNAVSKARVANGLPLLSYEKDQWKVDLGVAKRFNDKLAGTVQVGWDSGAGNPVSSLGPVEGYYSLGGGVKYNFTPEWALSVGGKYLKFGDATARLPTGDVVGKFEKNDGYIAAVKLSYEGK